MSRFNPSSMGNQGVAIPSSQLVQIPSQPFGSLGAMSEFIAGGATNDVMLRWDPAQRKTKTFIGKNELVEKEIGIDTYMRGRYFFLPDFGIDTGSIQVSWRTRQGHTSAQRTAGNTGWPPMTRWWRIPRMGSFP